MRLPELAPAIEEQQPYHRALTPDDLAAFLKLPETVVINTGCSLGLPPFADAFMRSGCRAYVGPTGDPEGDASLFYALCFHYELFCGGKSVRTAHDIASSHDAQTRMFQLYEEKT
ncbi:MAG TPA: hypothetical protein HPP77_01495 [Candidatus Hydrogenedentes bacterium]|nr:hypothetical protein [Candidatus Hydrogenedentota bacterium]